MKKISLCLAALLLFSWMLVAVESEPSEVVGYVRYDLVEGNNLLALPMALPEGWTGSNHIGDEIVGATSISRWIPGAGWGTSNYQAPFGWSAPFPISEGMPLMVNVSEPSSFYSLGKLPEEPTSYNLAAGNNIIMTVLDMQDLDETNWTHSNHIGDSVTGATSISRWIPGAGWGTSNYQAPFGWSAPFAVSIGMPLMINVSEGSVWPDRGEEVLMQPASLQPASDRVSDRAVERTSSRRIERASDNTSVRGQ